MSKTTNYQLTLWDYDDEDFTPKKAREDLAANFTKLDAALKNEETARVNGLNGKVGIVTGSYAGDDAKERSISLGFTPKAVYLCKEDGSAGYACGSVMCFGGLALPGLPVNANGNMVELAAGGIKVHHRTSNITTNSAHYKYRYIAFR